MPSSWVARCWPFAGDAWDKAEVVAPWRRIDDTAFNLVVGKIPSFAAFSSTDDSSMMRMPLHRSKHAGSVPRLVVDATALGVALVTPVARHLGVVLLLLLQLLFLLNAR
jgi:hypothetical protein